MAEPAPAPPHESAWLHVAGAAPYIDDLPERADCLHAAIAQASVAHGRLTKIDIAPALALPGVVAVMLAKDVPGINDCAPIVAGDPILAVDEIVYAGQAVAAVAATSLDAARRAASRIKIAIEPMPAIVTVDRALAVGSFLTPSQTMTKGDAADGLARAPRRLEGTLRLGGQDHFYLEGQVAMALPREGGDMLVLSSTQHPTEIQHLVAKALGRGFKDVVCEVRRMGGGFGGKETQAAQTACIAALLAWKTGRAVKLRLDRDVDMTLTGKRHDFRIDWQIGFDDAGRISAWSVDLAARGGCSVDLTDPVVDRAMFHADNAYYLEHARIAGHRCRTHTVSNTAFRGFGGPQGMCAIEYAIDEVARALGKDALDVRLANLYGHGSRDVTPYHQRIKDNILPELMRALETSSDYRNRRRAIAAWNAAHPWLKKGLALTPAKFGISFTNTFLNQAGALVHVYTDGTVQVSHGGTEMGQGLNTKIAQVVASAFALDFDRVKVTATVTDKVPNTSATAASAGTDLNGKAAADAADKIKRRLIAFGAEHFKVPPDRIRFTAQGIEVGTRRLTFAELVGQAYMARVQLWDSGFYATPEIHFDRERQRGNPFYYFAYGAACSEALIDVLTGESRILRADLLHDVGNSINPAIDLGQIEGGYIQGLGWLTAEELWWDPAGRLRTHAPSTYKIPTARDLPEDFRVAFWPEANHADTIHRSKAVGEPPLMLAISAWLAIKDAVAATAEHRLSPQLDAPATPERVLLAIEDLKRRAKLPAEARS
ncbi:MAG: xanthine dehydrogenase molybdopterin binding subunit [Alphaproteobacteria bacterium]|nr:xanthine dehydrogenase molybdopterin binding subunit [Alphaproteobacteria bacterium]